MKEDYDVNPFFEKFYEHLSSGQPGVNPYSHPMQQDFMHKRFKKEQDQHYVNRVLIQERAMLEQLEIFIKSMHFDGLMSDESFRSIKSEFKEKL